MLGTVDDTTNDTEYRTVQGWFRNALGDLNFMGHLFEALVIRDLRIYAQVSDASVLQYHDSTGPEVDAIVKAADGRWAAFEIRLRPRLVDEAAANLLKFADRIDTDQCRARHLERST